MQIENLITEHIDTWTSAVKKKNATGRGSSKKIELYGIKKLRELILELAVRGKLVPQDPSDEPASVLLERIAEEKAQLVKEKAIKKPKKIPEILEENIPHSLPLSWEWSQLGFLTNYGICDKAEASCMNDDEWVLELEDVEKTTSKLLKRVRFSDRVFKSSKNRFEKGDVIYGKLRPYLDKVLLADERGVCTTEMIPIRIYSNLIPEYLRLVLKSPCFINYANSSTHGMNLPRMGTDKARSALFPLAPINEQQRIVAKVDELMLLCDQLEQQTESSIDAHKTLVEVLLNTLTDAKDTKELQKNWARVSDFFDTLFTTEHSIEQLKQTILQLAVMGKLVPQNPTDEPACVLLEKIAAEKTQLIADKKIKKQKPLPAITDEEKPFELPNGWVWCKFGDIAEFINGDRGKNYPNKSEYVNSGVPWINTGHIEPDGTLTPTEMNYITKEKYKSLRGGKVQKGDLVYCLRGATFGKTAFVEPFNYGAIASSLMIIRPYYLELNCFIYRYLISPFGRTQIFRFDNGSAQPNLSANSVKLYAFPMPPLAEQMRIFKKIDELFTICDQLKSQLNQVQQTQLNLTDALVAQAV